jgi:solute carrier family 25 citrate transporter 1
MADPLDVPRYRNAAHAAYTIVREEGFRTLYRGVTLTALRQSTNQAVNFTAYTYFKQWALKYQKVEELPSYQHMVLGLVSGAMGPLSNAPIDTISEHHPCYRRLRLEAFYLRMGTETRLQRSSAKPGESALARIRYIAADMFKHEGFRAFYKGITPRIMRVAPGQVCEPGLAWHADPARRVRRLTWFGLGRDVHRVRVHPRHDGETDGSRGGQGIPRVSFRFT